MGPRRLAASPHLSPQRLALGSTVLAPRRSLGFGALDLRSRGLAILPQAPQLSRADLRREAQLKRRVDLAERASQARLAALRSRPKFVSCSSTEELLDSYRRKRPVLQPNDMAAAFFALGSLKRVPAHGGRQAQLPEDPRLSMLLEDLVDAVPRLKARQLSNVLQAAAYLQLRDERLLNVVCEHGARRADTFGPRDVVASIYSLGRLRWRNEQLLEPMIEIAERDVRGLHSIDLANLVTGLVGLRISPASLLHGVVDVALAKLDDFGSVELPALLSCLASLGCSNQRLLHAAAARFNDVAGGMNGRSLAEFAAAFATAELWLPPTLEALGNEASIKAAFFRPADTVGMLAAFGQLRWDQASASEALGRQLVKCAHRLNATQLGLALRAVTRLPLVRDANGGKVRQVLIRTVGEVPLPGVPPADEGHSIGAEGRAPVEVNLTDIIVLASLCNGLQHLGEEAPSRLKLAVSNLQLDAIASRGSHPVILRRALAKLAHARQAWGGNVPLG